MSFADVPFNPEKRKQSEYIRPRPSRNVHHAISLAKAKGLPLNRFVSLNFSLTDCPPENTDLAFRRVREFFTKWTNRPQKKARAHAAPPTFVYCIENQDSVLNAHWLVHVPVARHAEFAAKLEVWLIRATGGVYDELRAINIRAVTSARGLGKYMLKGLRESMAENWDIRAEYCGWVTGRRVGHSQNIGPVEMERMILAGQFERPKRYVKGKYRRQNQRQATHVT
jgi:hypothetical protein